MAGRFFGTPFGVLGDRIAVPDATQPDGSVSYAQGFGFDYERPNTDPAYKPVPREQTNAIYYDLTEALGIIQRQGAADWTADAAPYVINAQVRHDSSIWRSRIDNNNDIPAEGASWVRVDSRGQLIGVRVITASGVYNPTVGTRSVVVEVQGGGGGGGGVSASSTPGQGATSGGGGAGGYAQSYLTTGFSGVFVTIGAGGVGAAPGWNDGFSGGTSSFGTLLSATPGVGGFGAGATGSTILSWPANMGTGSGGNIVNFSGKYGMHGISAPAGTSAGQFVGAGGGDSQLGSGGAGGGAGQVAIDGLGYGSGGGGVSSNAVSSPTARAGGNGRPGVVIVWEYA